MRRRTFVAAALAGAATPLAAHAQGFSVAPITPANALEEAFIAALNSPQARPVFRRRLLREPVTLALATGEPDAGPLSVPVPTQGGGRLVCAAVFTSSERLISVLGGEAHFANMTGRAALTRLTGQNVVLNYRLIPMLTLEPADVAEYLATPAR